MLPDRSSPEDHINLRCDRTSYDRAQGKWVVDRLPADSNDLPICVPGMTTVVHTAMMCAQFLTLLRQVATWTRRSATTAPARSAAATGSAAPRSARPVCPTPS